MLTPLELSRHVKAYRTRERGKLERTALLGHWVFVAWRGTKDSPTPKQLLGEDKLNPEAAEATLNELVTGEPADVSEFDRFMQKQKEALGTGT